jgi:hypothetical protein
MPVQWTKVEDGTVQPPKKLARIGHPKKCKNVPAKMTKKNGTCVVYSTCFWSKKIGCVAIGPG